MKNILISSSILACDFADAGNQIHLADIGGTDWIHIDVMDGHFVNNITFGPPVVSSLRKHTDKFFDVHLMIEHPLQYIDSFAKSGADGITFHTECKSDISKTIDKIKENSLMPALSIKPSTDAEAVFPYLDRIGLVLVMTVEPGFGGQAFIPEMTEKIRKIRREADRRNLDIHIQVDGGINPDTARKAKEAGADVLVAGSAVFGAQDMKKAIEQIRNS